MGRLLINCDLGENEPTAVTAALLSLIDAANICCGWHAGSRSKTLETLCMAVEKDCLIGAHPGLGENGGRGDVVPSVSAFRRLLEEQLDVFNQLAHMASASPAYVKLHGSLYHYVEQSEAAAKAYLNVLQQRFGSPAIFTLAGGRCAQMARACGLVVYEEIFADRAYLATGQLLPRSEPNAVLKTEAAIERLMDFVRDGRMRCVDGAEIPLSGDTVCVHGDTEAAVDMIRELRSRLHANST